MIRSLTAGSALAFLIACGDGQMLANDARCVAERFGAEACEGTASDLDPDDIPPGTEDPVASRDLNRYEDRDDFGGGLVQDVRYNRDDDTFFVDNLAFDGENIYNRHSPLPTLNGYLVFAGEEEVEDFLDGDAIRQFQYRAIYGESDVLVDGRPRTLFAIVRTGSYVGFGFGGFVYERDGGVDMPDSGQARFEGPYAGIRVFSNSATGESIEYVTGEMFLDIDFEDFNANEGIKGGVINRQIFADDGSTTAADARDVEPIGWIVVEGVNTLTDAGEIVNPVFSTYVDDDGVLQNYFEGEFTGIVAGDTLAGDGGEIVGVISMIAERDDDSLVQETGGAILSR